jgi:ADP-heptose:LPS heptosyltransferase
MSAVPRRHGCPDPRSVRRVAVVRALYLGDMLLAVPALRALRHRFPGAEITLIGLPWAESFARRYSRYVDRFIPFVGYPGIAEVEVDQPRVRAFLRAQRAWRYDLVVQLHGSGRASTPFALALRGRMTAGYYEREWQAGLTYGAPYPDAGPEVLRNLGIARLLGCADLSPRLEFPLTQPDRDEADELLRGLDGRGPLVGLHTGARAPSRRWPASRFAQVADALASQGARIVLTGDASELTTVREVADRMSTPPLIAAGRTSLGGLAALIARMGLFISNDTGPAHLAEAVGTPSLRLVGPADPARWASLDTRHHPYLRVDVGCNPCPHTDCPIDHRCLLRLEVDDVVAEATHLLALSHHPVHAPPLPAHGEGAGERTPTQQGAASCDA